jgi:hypothetical protein
MYMIATLSVAIVAWLGLAALAAPFSPAGKGTGGGVIVSAARGMATLPLHYRDRISRLDDANDLAWMSFLPVLCKPNVAVTLNAWGGPGTHRQLAGDGVSEEQARAWDADPLGVIVAAPLAEKCGWMEGTHVQPPDGFIGRPIEVHVVGVFRSSQPYADLVAFAHYDYLNRLAMPEAQDQAQMFSVHTNDPRDAAALAARVDQAFAHGDPPTDSHASNEEQSALARYGKVQTLIAWVMAAMLGCVALVFVSVFAHASAERRSLHGVVQALGFRRSALVGALLIESLLIVAGGFALGIASGWCAITLAAPIVAGVLGAFTVPSWAWFVLPALALALLGVSLPLPLGAIARSRAIDYREA